MLLSHNWKMVGEGGRLVRGWANCEFVHTLSFLPFSTLIEALNTFRAGTKHQQFPQSTGFLPYTGGRLLVCVWDKQDEARVLEAVEAAGEQRGSSISCCGVIHGHGR